MRLVTQKKKLGSFPACVVKIKRNQKLEKLLVANRASKINARRKTISIEVGVSHQNPSIDKYKKITNKPFITRRRHSTSNASSIHGTKRNAADISTTKEHQVDETMKKSTSNAHSSDVSLKPDETGNDDALPDANQDDNHDESMTESESVENLNNGSPDDETQTQNNDINDEELADGEIDDLSGDESEAADVPETNDFGKFY